MKLNMKNARDMTWVKQPFKDPLTREKALETFQEIDYFGDSSHEPDFHSITTHGIKKWPQDEPIKAIGLNVYIDDEILKGIQVIYSVIDKKTQKQKTSDFFISR